MLSKFPKPLTFFRLAQQHVGRQPPSSRPPIVLLRSAAPSQNHRYLSSTAMPEEVYEDYNNNLDYNGPQGELFHGKRTLGPSLTGKTASIRRVFGAGSNAAGLLTCGGEQLARHASFDPDYSRAQGWIRHHAVGPAVLSPVLISGLVGALVEAVFPNSIPVNNSMSHLKPLIVSHNIWASWDVIISSLRVGHVRSSHIFVRYFQVGVEVCAKIKVMVVVEDTKDAAAVSTKPNFSSRSERKNGVEVELETEVVRVQDGVPIAKGVHKVWIPDHLNM